jgi:hypothetical protein
MRVICATRQDTFVRHEVRQFRPAPQQEKAHTDPCLDRTRRQPEESSRVADQRFGMIMRRLPDPALGLVARSAPFRNTAPARTRAIRCGPLTARQRCSAASSSLNAIASLACLLP